MNIWKCTKVYTAFHFADHTFWKEDIIEDIIGIKHFKLLFKDNNS